MKFFLYLGIGIAIHSPAWANPTCAHSQYIGYFLNQEQSPESLQYFLRAEIKRKFDPQNISFESLPRASQTFRAVLKYFDLKTVALLQRGIAIQEIPDLNYVLNETLKLEQRRKDIALDKINSTSAFLEAASKLIGRQIKIRDFDVVMSSESDLAGDLSIDVDSASEEQIQRNPFLRIYSKKQIKNQTRIGVEYTSLKVLKKISKDFPHLFSPSLAQRIQEIKLDRSGQVLDPKDGVFLKKAIRSLLDHLITGDITAPTSTMSLEEKNFLLYQSFMALHPFEDGNGRSGRLFYELLSQRAGSPSKFLTIPIFDLDLLGGKSIHEMNVVGVYLNDWIAKAKNESNFLERSHVALKALADLWPNLKVLFPEIAKNSNKNKSKTAKVFDTKKDLKIKNSNLNEM